MYEGKTSSLFIRYAVPQMIGLTFNSIYMIVDGVFIGHRLGTDAMAAAAVSVPLIEILIALSMAIASGAGVLVSGDIARKDRKRAVSVFNTAFSIAIVLGLVVMVLGNIFINEIAYLFGSTAAIHDLTIGYMRYIMIFAPFMVLNFLLSGMVRNDGSPRLAMIALTIGSLSNVLLDYVFMYPLNMGIEGAALATALGPILSIMILIPHFTGKKGVLQIKVRTSDFIDTKTILRLGFPSFIMEFTIGIITFVYNAAIIRCGFGELGLAAYLIIGYLMLIILTLFLGMAEGLQPVFSFFHGAGNSRKLSSMLRFSVVVFLVLGVICVLAAYYGSHLFYSIFNPEDIGLIEFSTARSKVYFTLFFAAGFNILMISFWQATGKTGKSLTVSLSRSLLFPPILTAIIPLLAGPESIWFCHSLSEALTAVVALLIIIASRKAMADSYGTDA